MSKLNKEYKNEIDNNFKEFDYAGRKMFKRIAIVLIVITIVGGLVGVGYTYTIGKWQTNAERVVFKSSVAYTEQAASFLAKSYKEYNAATDKSEKKAIMEYVILRYPNLDTDSIDNIALKNFYIKCLN